VKEEKCNVDKNGQRNEQDNDVFQKGNEIGMGFDLSVEFETDVNEVLLGFGIKWKSG